MDRTEAETTLNLAIGRLFRLLSRAEQPGDANEYHRLRSAAMDAADVLGMSATDNRPCYARDYNRGAAGD